MILSSDNACDSLDWFSAAGSLINNLSLPLSSLVGYATHFYGKQIILWCDVEDSYCAAIIRLHILSLP